VPILASQAVAVLHFLRIPEFAEEWVEYGEPLFERHRFFYRDVAHDIQLFRKIEGGAPLRDWDLYLGSNPLRKVKFFQEVNTGFRVLSLEEESRLLANAIPTIQDIVLYALNTGSRIGEIFSLRWRDVNLDRNLVTVFSSKTQKTGPIPINPDVRRILEFWGLGRKNEFVFYNQKTETPFVDLSAGLELATKKAGISGVTWHTLRHTFASRLLERGVDIMTVKELLGHSTVTVTMRYTHSNLDSKVAAVGKLAGNCYNPATLCTKLQQSSPKVSQIGR
jgi:integrase